MTLIEALRRYIDELIGQEGGTIKISDFILKTRTEQYNIILAWAAEKRLALNKQITTLQDTQVNIQEEITDLGTITQ